IGLARGSSMNLWCGFFPTAEIVGVDITLHPDCQPCSLGDGIYVFSGDSGDAELLRRLHREGDDQYSFIIDDGAHTPDSQMAAFNHLFKTALEDGGTYFIEDIETSYWTTGSLYGNEYRGGGRGNGEEGQNVIEIFKALADAVNKEFFTASGLAEEDVPFIDPEVAGMVESVEFGANVVAITKREEERHAFYHDRAYRTSDYVEGYGA
ncbi:hypothetical protein TeGR_g14413, partial [Tetraparma gracilis]